MSRDVAMHPTLPFEAPVPKKSSLRAEFLIPSCLAFLLGVLTVAAFSPILSNGFSDGDDDENFLRNSDFRGIGASQCYWSWTTTLLGVYQPLSWMLLGAESAAWGLDPRGYHAASLALHFAVASALFVLVDKIISRGDPEIPTGARQLASALSAALFAVHPLRAEAVAWASCQPYLPCALAMILSALVYLRAHRSGETTRPRSWLTACLGLYAAALLFKAAAVALPAALVAMDVWPLRRIGPGRWWGGHEASRAAWREKLPFLVVGAGFALVAVQAKASDRSLAAVSNYGLAQRLAQASYANWFYLARTFWPGELSAFYVLPKHVSWSDPRYVASAAALTILTLAVLLLRKRSPGLLAAWFCYLALLSPCSGIVRVGREEVAARYSYVAVLPVAVAIGALLARTKPSIARFLFPAFACVLFMDISLTRRQCATWHDPETLWTQVLSRGGPASAIAHLCLGVKLAEQGRGAESLGHLVEAARLDPDDPEIQNVLGIALARRGRLDEARDHFAVALRLDPESPEAMSGMGLILSDRGFQWKAASLCSEAVKRKPRSAAGHAALGTVRIRQGRIAEAVSELSTALRLDGRSAATHQNLGQALAQLGRLREAKAHFEEALRLNPGFAQAESGLAEVLWRDGLREKALAHYRRALDLRPNSSRAHLDLGRALAELGHDDEAIERLVDAVRLDPNTREASRLLKNELASRGIPEAVADRCIEGLTAAPDDREARRLIAEALPGTRRGPRP